MLKLRVSNRRLLESVCDRALHPYGIQSPVTLAYQSSREWVFPTRNVAQARADVPVIGEIGLLYNIQRSATCVVYTHPKNTLIDNPPVPKAQLYYLPPTPRIAHEAATRGLVSWVASFPNSPRPSRCAPTGATQ